MLPVLGERAVGDLRPVDIQARVSDWSKRLAPRTVRRVYGTLRAVLNHAVLRELIGRFPCRGIQLPSVEPVERPLLTPADLVAVAEALGPSYGAMAYVGAVLGLRWGECAGLRVGRIDFERSVVTVAEQVTRGPGGTAAVGPPKSTAGRRTLAAPPALMAILSAHLTHRGLSPNDHDAFVFTGPDGEQLDYSNWLHRIWYPARRQAGIEWLQFHDLRRANATGLVIEGVDIKTTQTRLGHTDPRLTLSIYAQAVSEADRAAAKVLERRFLGRSHDAGPGFF